MNRHRVRLAARKPLRDVSNGCHALRSRKKSTAKETDDGADMDRLLLVRSDLSSLIGQIDELIARAIDNKTISKKACQDIDAFKNILSDMHVSLKPWFSRLQKSFGTSTAPENRSSQSLDANPVSGTMGDRDAVGSNRDEPELQLIVSPSPLVSWRAGGTCTVDCGRQLFLLTPLPKSKSRLSKCLVSSKSVVGIFTDKEQSSRHKFSPSLKTSGNAPDDLLGCLKEKKAPTDVSKSFSFEEISDTSEIGYASPLSLSDHNNRKYEVSPSIPWSSGLLDPIFEPHQEDGEISELAEDDGDNEEVSNDLDDEVSDSLATKYQEIFGLQTAPGFTSRRKEVDETLDWFLSPPKTCVLLEPSDEIMPLPTPATPIWKDVESPQRVKLPGETTLKRELWTKFDAASSNQLQFDVSIFQRTGRRGFLDMLEEVSSETTDSRVAR